MAVGARKPIGQGADSGQRRSANKDARRRSPVPLHDVQRAARRLRPQRLSAQSGKVLTSLMSLDTIFDFADAADRADAFDQLLAFIGERVAGESHQTASCLDVDERGIADQKADLGADALTKLFI